MPKQASASTVQTDLRPADFRGAVNLIRSLKKKKDQQSSISGEMSKIWSQVEGDKKVNKKGAAIFAKLDNMPPEERNEVMRAFNGLAAVAEWPTAETDLVDQAEDTSVALRKQVPSHDDEPEDEDEEEDLEDEDDDTGVNDRELDASDFEEASDEELAAQKGRKEAAEARSVRGAGAKSKVEGAPLH